MDHPEFMPLQIKCILNKIIENNNIKDNENGWVYVWMELGMNRLPQAGRLANNYLRNVWTLKGTIIANIPQSLDAQMVPQCLW